MVVTADNRQRFSDAWESLFRTTRRLRARAGRLPGEAHMSVPQYHLLEPLRAGGELPVGELAEAAGVTAPTATRMLDHLARSGYITRRPAAHDRRSVLVGLTADGKAALEIAHRHVEEWRGRVLDRLDPQEREQAAVIMERLSQVVAEEL